MKTRLVLEFSERWLKAVVATKEIILEPLGADNLSSTEALSRVFRQITQRKGLEVVVVLSRNRITVRRLDLPSRDSVEMAQILGLNVIRHVTYPKEEIIWGWQNLGFDGVSNSHILLAIVHRQMLKDIFNAFMSFAILPEAMLMSSQGVIHYLHDTLKDKSLLQETYFILDIDHNFSDLILVNNQCLRSTVVISQGTQQLKSEPERDKFGAELKQALVVLNNEIPNKKPTRFFLTGASEEIAALAEVYLEKDFNLKFQFAKSQEVQNLGTKYRDVSFSAVLGFSYQRKKEDISFLLPEIQIKKEIKLKIRQLLILGGCLTYIFILLGAMALVRLSQIQSYRDKLNAHIAQLKQDTGGLPDIVQKINLVRKYQDAKQSVLTYIYELTRLCPDNITLTSLNWEWQKGFSVRGYALRMPDIFNFVSSLDGSGIFKGAQTRYTRRRKAKDQEVIDFEIGIK